MRGHPDGPVYADRVPLGRSGALHWLLGVDAAAAHALNDVVRRSKRGQGMASLAASGLAGAEVGLMLVLAARGHRQDALRMLSAVGTVYAVCEVLGRAVPRERPFAELARVQELVAHRPGRSFPSRHTASGLAMAAIAGRAHRGVGWTMAGLAWALGLSRVAAGLHYPSDVLAGAALGTLVGYRWRR